MRSSCHRFVACCCFTLPAALVSNALLQTLPRECSRRSPAVPSLPSAPNVFFRDGNMTPQPRRRRNTVHLGSDRVNGSDEDLFKTLELKDEALMQMITAVSSLEKAQESAVTNLENMQQQLQLQVMQMEQELMTTKQELSSTNSELEQTKAELQNTQVELMQSQQESARLEVALAQRADELEAYVQDVEENASPPAAHEKESDNPWQFFAGSPKVIPVLNDWIAIKGTNDGEFQISGKVTNHPTIPNGDAIVTSPLTDPGKASEKKIVTTVSGSKYRLGTQMTLPPSDAQSVTITSPKKKAQQLIKARSSISIPDLTGNTLGNGRYLLAGDAFSSINGRSYIQTAYRSSPFGKTIGEPLAIKFSPNREAMKREYANYQKVNSGLNRGKKCFIRLKEFLPVAGSEMPDQSALVMQRGVADVKAFMPKVGGALEGVLLMDCARTVLRCVQVLHSVGLVWNDLKTENFVVIEDNQGGVSFRGIDLESCMPVNTSPVDYTPEACPPEFARSFLDGEAESFRLEYSYDVWSYGMMLYEVSTGRGFFDGYSAEQITKSLPTFQPNIDKVEDPVLADLISRCLSTNPKERPPVSRIANHQFFASAEKNPFDFLFGI